LLKGTNSLLRLFAEVTIDRAGTVAGALQQLLEILDPLTTVTETEFGLVSHWLLLSALARREA
jgi:hypothetical protein